MKSFHFEFIVEEESMKNFLDMILPKLLGNKTTFVIHFYQGKHELLKRLQKRLNGYVKWLPENYRIVVMVDQDDEKCIELKKCTELKLKLEEMCKTAGLRSKSATTNADWQLVTRIAMEELEAWYFGDWQAVCAAYPKVSSTIPKQVGYRNPDAISGGTWQALERILQRAGYYKQGMPKIEVARNIGGHFDPGRNKSRSFQVFQEAILEAVR